jgi:DNA-binding HxlR family transcriptional regulator
MSTSTRTDAPPALAYSTDNCTLGRAMAVLGERWTVVVLREVFLGIRRFDDIRRHSGIPRQVLTKRLAALVDQGMLRKVPYQETGARTRYEYRLTQQGLDLQPVLVAIAAWGDTYLADAGGPPIEFVHRDCGERLRVELRCDAGHRLESPREAGSRPGPGVRPFGE